MTKKIVFWKTLVKSILCIVYEAVIINFLPFYKTKQSSGLKKKEIDMNQVVSASQKERHYQIYSTSPQYSKIHPLKQFPMQQNSVTFKSSKTTLNTIQHG